MALTTLATAFALGKLEVGLPLTPADETEIENYVPPGEAQLFVPSPLEGLPALRAVALLGRDKILALAAKPVEYAWQDIAVRGTIVMTAGSPGDGKTTLLFLILAARANVGEPISLLARRVVPAAPGKYVVLIEGEHAEASACRKLVRSVRVLGLDDAALDRIIIIARKAVRLGSPEWLDIVRLIAAGLVEDVAIDTVARVMPADGSSEQEQVALFDQVAQAIDAAPTPETRPIVWAVGHTRKNNQSGDLSDVSGSAQRTGQADSVLLLKAERVDGRVVASRVTFAKLREEPDEYPMPVSFTIADGHVHTSEMRDDDDRPLEDRVLEQLHIGPRTKNALAKTLGRSGKDVESAITNLFSVRAIRTTTALVRGQQRKAFCLPKDGARLPSMEDA